MKNIKIVVFLIIYVSISDNVSAQSQLPDFFGFIYHWQQAGYQGDIPTEDDVINVILEFGADNTGIYDSWSAINAAILEANDRVSNQSNIDYCAVYLPEGTYLVKDQINMLDNVILKGDGSG